MPVGTPVDVSSIRNILDTFKQTGWRCSSRQFCYCVIGGLDVAQRIRCWPQAFRFMPPRSGLSRSDFVLWPIASLAAVQQRVRNRVIGRAIQAHGPECPPRDPTPRRRVLQIGGACDQLLTGAGSFRLGLAHLIPRLTRGSAGRCGIARTSKQFFSATPTPARATTTR